MACDDLPLCGAGVMDFTAHYQSPLGAITMASDGTSLVGLWFDGQRFYASTLSSARCERPGLEVFADTRRWLDIYFSGRDPGFVPPLLLRTSAFRQRVWQELLTIPFGCTATYGQIALRIAQGQDTVVSARAVGGAIGHNSISLIIPCHRVVASDGSLTGYAAGLERKATLLNMEKNGKL